MNSRGLLSLVVGLAFISGLVGQTEAAPAVGSVQGRVVYHSDSGRPWRFGRYYIKYRKRGELAEAVVAVTGRRLQMPAEARAPRLQTIDQRDFQFVPETTAIRTIDRVRFLNSDGAVHDVRCTDPRQSFSMNMPPGSEHIQRFSRAGGIRRPYRLGCIFHGSMRAWVYVFDHPYFQVTGADGAFQLRDIPAGKYRLEMAHPAGGLRWSEPITVTAGIVSQVTIDVSPDDKK